MPTLIHNPRCSKSRATLALLQTHDIDIEIIEYLDTPLNETALAELIKQLNLPAQALIRSKDDTFKSLNLDLAQLADRDIVKLLAAHPKLLERPIFINNNQARIGRPPEHVLEII